MRVPVILGFLFALLVGTTAIAVVMAGIANQPPIVRTLQPTTTPVAMATPQPTDTPTPTETPTEATPTPSGGATFEVGTAIGQRAPDFVLPHVAGGEISLAASSGKPVWVNFMATWCPPCIDELPMMQRMRLDLGDSIDFIVVDVGEDQETVSDFLISLGVDLPVGLDQNSSVQRQWGAFALPVHFWLDGDGIVRQFVFGGAPRDVFEEAVRTVVPDAEFTEQ